MKPRWMKLMTVAVTCVMAGTMAGQAKAQSGPPTLPPDARLLAAALQPERHPRFVMQPDDLPALRQAVEKDAWRKQYLANMRKIVAPVMKLSDDELRALVPPPGSLFIYGLGMNLDPVHHQRLTWAGWDKPRSVVDVNKKEYPNADWPDDGTGITRDGKTHYFVAIAHGRLINELEFRVLPALADIWAMTGSQREIEIAAVLLDAIAAVYPTNRRGPMDYPTSPGHMDRGGRLQRPYYQAARAMQNFAHVIDLAAASGVLQQPSVYQKGKSIASHVARNLVWDGGLYCYEFAAEGYALHNGQIDYERGAALAAVLLDDPRLASPMIAGPVSFPAMLRNNIDGSGVYYESAASYANHTRSMYIEVMDIFRAMRWAGWPGVEDLTQDLALRNFLLEPFDRQQVAGHMPLLGDSGPDRSLVPPTRRLPAAPRVYMDNFLDSQIASAWYCLANDIEPGQVAALLKRTYGDQPIAPPVTRWGVFNLTQVMLDQLDRDAASLPADAQAGHTKPTFLAETGLALLRGGQGDKAHGIQLFYGPIMNHGQMEALTWTAFAHGAEWSFDPGYYNRQFRFGFTRQSVAHQALVVDETSYDIKQGPGQLLAWHAGPQVQWAMAEHPRAYRDKGVTRYERFIAQAQDDQGQLAYWLDVGIVEGGQVRDDSFHSQMKVIEHDAAVEPSGRPAMVGDIDMGRIIRADMSLEGMTDKPFYWSPPTDGYGFLGNPRRLAVQEGGGVFRATLKEAAFGSLSPVVMRVDIAMPAGRELWLADGPQTGRLHPAVPYLISRDRGQGVSVFAKLMRLPGEGQTDVIDKLEIIPGAPATGGAWLVRWQSGRADLWVVQQAGQGVTIESPGLPAVQTDARVTFIRFDASGQPVQATAQEGTRLAVAGVPALQGPAAWTGRIAKVDPAVSPATFDVDWEDGVWPQVADAVQDDAGLLPQLARTVSPKGQRATWQVQAIQAGRLTTTSATPILGVTQLGPGEHGADWLRMHTSVSRLISSGSRPNHGQAHDRPVYVGDRLVARSRDVHEDTRHLRLDRSSGVFRQPTQVNLLLAGQDDRVIVPLTLHWEKSAER